MRRFLHLVTGIVAGFGWLPLFIWMAGVDIEFKRDPMWAAMWFFCLLSAICGFFITDAYLADVK